MRAGLFAQVTIKRNTHKSPVVANHQLVNRSFLIKAEFPGESIERFGFIYMNVLVTGWNHPNGIVGEKVKVSIKVVGANNLQGLENKLLYTLVFWHENW